MRTSLLLPLFIATLATSASAQVDRPPALTELGEPFFQQAVETQPNAWTDAELAAAPPIDRAAIQSQRRTLLYYTEHADGLWVRGRTYKARISESGFTYIPFLGSKAPRNYPASFRLASASVEGRALDLTAQAEVRREGDRMILDRGPVDVLYDMALESVEQSFALDATGLSTDLMLDLDFTTDLAVKTLGGGFAFEGPMGGIHYSAAVVFDGAGRSANVPATLVDGRIRLTVPAEFLAIANGPILVDPVFATYAIDQYDGDQENVDAAYSIVNDAFTYVYEDYFSGADADVYSTTIDSSGAFLSARYVDSSAESVEDPHIATLASANAQLIVAVRHHPSTGFHDVVGRILYQPAGGLSAELTIAAGNADADPGAPDVGGQFAAAGTQFCVVWHNFYTSSQEADPLVAMVDTSGVISTISSLEITFDRSETSVEISESTGDPATVNRWNIVYRSEDLASGDQSLRATQLLPTGFLLFFAVDLEASPLGSGTFGEYDVSDALNLGGLDPTYLVNYDRYGSTESDGQIMVCRGDSRINTVDLAILEHGVPQFDKAQCRFSTTSTQFVLTHYEKDPQFGPYYVFSTALDLTLGGLLAISERRVVLGQTGGSYAGSVGVASRFSGGMTSSKFIGTAWAELNLSTGNFDVQGATYNASLPTATAPQYCYGNPNSTGDRGFLTLYGDSSATTQKTLQASALPLNASAYFLTSQTMASIPNPGGSQGILCIGGSIGRYSNLAGSTGSTGTILLGIDPTMLSQPGGPVIGAPGETWNFQLWHRDSANGVPTSNFTNAVALLLN
ncbi:hypothetical protein Poly30_02020 [Planctomycetes bacterium Poly30]|uniref:Uncharacterized protein n=1 Tax=Saltatorellus ferox TaxID=2528018 RepID=A0A518EKU6_9BACT|nr:hypothetical protein Poly30_02020 [Planctomycetes bacterium Poly30]